MTDYKENQILDCTGLNCPLPILKTKKMIDTMNDGEILKMVASDPGSVNDVQAWAKMTGNELLESIVSDGTYTFYIKKILQ